MTISVIIPTYKGENKIANILGALAKQTYKEFEVIVAIDGAVDNTENIARQFFNVFQQIKIITQPNGGRAAIRNFGAKNATGELLVFYDDDMIPYPDSVLKHHEFHSLGNLSAIVSGYPIEYIEPNKTDIQNYKAWLTKKWTEKFSSGINLISKENLFLTAANVSITKNLFFNLNGFDERLNDIEDYEFAYRALQRGAQLFFDKSNLAIHNDEITCKSYLERMKQYSRAQSKIRKLFQDIPQAERPKTLKWKLLYSVFVFPFWIRIIDANSFLFVLPKRIRYELYAKILYAQSVLFYD